MAQNWNFNQCLNIPHEVNIDLHQDQQQPLHKSDHTNNLNQWQCNVCTLLNNGDSSSCEACVNPRQSHNTHNNLNNNNLINEYDLFQSQRNDNQNTMNTKASVTNDQWQCKQCTCLNDINLPYCEACFTHRYNDNTNNNSNKLNINTLDDTDIAQQIHNEELQRIKQFNDDLHSAKQLEQKYQEDEAQFICDRQLALKMQKEFAQGLAWFCASCFTMNLNIQSYDCQLCATKRPKPKIPDVLTVRDQVCMEIIEMIRNVAQQQNINCIVNLALAQNFVTKYLQMCKQRGLQVAQPQICYHWTREQLFAPIKKRGLKVPDGHKVKHSTDTGYYGKGIYMSPNPNYAKGYGRGAKQFFVALSLTGKQYSAKYPRDLGVGLKVGYDSHMSSDNVNGQTKIPNEWVFFKPEQLLLCFQITLDQVQYVIPILNQVLDYLVSKYDDLNKKGGIRGL